MPEQLIARLAFYSLPALSHQIDRLYRHQCKKYPRDVPQHGILAKVYL